MKTPDEIKKGLEYCGNLDRGCAGCPYDDDCSTQGKSETVELDAIAYIIDLEQRLAQAERERDVLANALEGIKFCGDCLHLYSKDQGMCLSCSQDRERSKPLWQWRGVCEENSNASS